MKRIVCLMLAALMLICFAGCKDKKAEEKPVEETVDLEYFVRQGKIPECDFTVGAKGEEIAGKQGAVINEGFRYICIAYNNTSYYYEKEAADDTVTCLVSFNGAYGFEMGTAVYEITSKLANGNMKAEPQKLTEDDTFFMPVQEDYDGIKYTYGDHTVCFVFRDGALCACSMR